MARRWIIRSLALTLLTLCVVAWAGSYWRDWKISSYDKSGKWYSTQVLRDGCITFTRSPNQTFDLWSTSEPVGTPTPTEGLFGDPPATPAARRLLGFVFEPPPFLYVSIPLWFPTLLIAVLLWLVWRTTRPKAPGRAFPVEPATKSGELKP